MIEKKPIDPSRVRCLPEEGFSWIDRRFVRGGFLRSLTPNAGLLYFFLAAVSDREGLSFYGDATISDLLDFAPGELEAARGELVRASLILFRLPLYQVAPLPTVAPSLPAERERTPRAASAPIPLAEILAEAMRRPRSTDSRKDGEREPGE